MQATLNTAVSCSSYLPVPVANPLTNASLTVVNLGMVQVCIAAPGVAMQRVTG